MGSVFRTMSIHERVDRTTTRDGKTWKCPAWATVGINYGSGPSKGAVEVLNVRIIAFQSSIPLQLPTKKGCLIIDRLEVARGMLSARMQLSLEWLG